MRRQFDEVAERVGEAARQAGRTGSEVEILVATKYVAADDMGVLRDAGVVLVGENRAQDLAAKHEARSTTRYEDVLADKEVQAVVLAVPHALHAPIAIAAGIARKRSAVSSGRRQ